MRLTGAKGFAIGVAGLAAAQLFLSSDRGTKAYGTIVTLPTSWLAKWFDPTQPLIADHRSASSGGGTDPCAGMSGATLQLCRQGGGKAPGQDCSKLFGYAHDFCVAGQSSVTSPPGPTTTQIPTTSASSLQV